MVYLSLGLRLFLAFVCLAAVVGKLRGRAGFDELGRTLARAGVPAAWTTPAAAGLLLAESAVVVLVPWPATALAGSVLALGLFVALTTGVAVVVRRGTDLPCRCFGRSGARMTVSHVVRNAVLVVAAAAAVVTVPHPGGGIGSVVGGVLAGVVAVVAASLIVAWDDLAALAPGDLVVEVRR
jgi:hypothetical protein